MSALSPFLQVEDVVLDLQVTGKAQLFAHIGQHMERVHALAAETVVSGLMRREQAGSTALGEGVAIPHARVRDLDRVRVLYLRLTPALAFEAPDAQPVRDVLVLLVPGPATDEHLQILAYAASLFCDRGFRAVLHDCTEAEQVQQVFTCWTPAPGATGQAMPKRPAWASAHGPMPALAKPAQKG